MHTYLIILVAKQNFEIRVIDEFILLGNSAIMKCLLPSFVSDFVQIISWLIIDVDESTEINLLHGNFGKSLKLILDPLIQKLGWSLKSS